MITRRTNRIRFALDALEAREVCTTNLALNTVANLMPVIQMGQTGPVEKTPAPVSGKAGTNPGLAVADSVITLRNSTTHTLQLTVRWDGSAAAESYTLLPGQTQRVWYREVERVWRGRPATITVDGGSGLVTFRATSAIESEGPNGPDGKGQVYTFRSAHGKVTLGKMVAAHETALRSGRVI